MSWPTPRRIPGLDGARSLFFYGSSAVCARIGDGSVRCYGDVSRFIGFPPYYPPLLAGTPVASLGSVRAIDGTRLVTLLLHDDLSAEYFAAGSSGVPEVRASVASAGAVTAVSAGNGWGALIMSDGSVSLVGYDVLAETDATRDRSLGPRPLPGATGVVAVAVGGTQAVGLRADGTVLRWGEVRDLRTRVWYRTATPMPGLRDIVEIAEGDRMGCARSRTGALFCWNLGDGYVGDGVWEARPDPVPISL